jgi:23S rRNA (uracil1939-C5)-methyltransferase
MALDRHVPVASDRLPSAEVTSLSHDGRGVARVEGKIVFIDNALPGERVRYRPGKRRRAYDTGALVDVLTPSPQRVTAKCRYFGICGGCTLQHLDPQAQLDIKQDQLIENLEKIGKTTPDTVLPPLRGPSWGYRRKARLGVRFVPKKGGILVGFRERRKSFVTPLQHCEVLDPRISILLPSLSEAIAGLSCRERIPQIEVAVGDNAMALVFRHLDPLTEQDLNGLSRWGEVHRVQVFLQPGDLDSVYPLSPQKPEPLYYSLGDYEIDIEFSPTDFIQVNRAINHALVTEVVNLLEPSAADHVLDLFCGLGNFTLPIARCGAEVTGCEGNPVLIAKANHNAERNNCSNARFTCVDLDNEQSGDVLVQQRYNKVLLDPPRTGAIQVAKKLPQAALERIVYVSCNPATLARDTEVIVNVHGFRLTAAGVVDMFPHTQHVESIAMYDRG